MIIIDWISTHNHRNFNRAFFKALENIDSTCIVFSEDLVIPEVKCIFKESSSSRFGRAIDVFKLILLYRKSRIVLLTYDHLWLPFILPFTRNLAVFEHNTTPEKDLWLKALWHKYVLKKVLRMAQFPGQHKRLKDLSLDAHYIGSPIQLINVGESKRALAPGFFTAPTIGNNVNLILSKGQFFQGESVIMKKNSSDERDEFSLGGVQFKLVERVDIDSSNLKGIIVTTNSDIRGSGWFNEAIAHNIPIVIIDHKSELMFNATFPGYPFYREAELKLLEEHYRSHDSASNMVYCKKHNEKFRNRFLQAIN